MVQYLRTEEIEAFFLGGGHKAEDQEAKQENGKRGNKRILLVLELCRVDADETSTVEENFRPHAERSDQLRSILNPLIFPFLSPIEAVPTKET